MTRYPYAIGAEVRGANCIGIGFTGTVTEIRGPYTVVLDGQYVTPVELIRDVITSPSDVPTTKAATIIPENMPEPQDDLSDLIDDAPPAGQMSLL